MPLPAVIAAKDAIGRAFETSLAEGVRHEKAAFYSLFATHDKNSQLVFSANGAIMGSRINNQGALNLNIGFANTAGGVLGAYILMLVGYFPNIAAHLISASVLSAPAAFIMAKVMVPEREVPITRGDVDADVAVDDANVLDAASNGATVGWQLAMNVAAMLLTFIALIAMVNLGVRWLGGFLLQRGC